MEEGPEPRVRQRGGSNQVTQSGSPWDHAGEWKAPGPGGHIPGASALHTWLFMFNTQRVCRCYIRQRSQQDPHGLPSSVAYIPVS